MRLIDADELSKRLIDSIEYLKNQHYETYASVGDSIKFVIDNQPTAYSVNKVVEELEEIRKKDVCDYLYCDVCAYTDKCSGVTDQSNNLKWDKAIEIVNQGGVSDDVCEWKLKDTCYTSSIKHYDALPTSIVKTFSNCPYCGKKIKVVE